MINTNVWNRIRYTIYHPFYDLVGRYFSPHRQTSINALGLSKNDNILIVGAGTGLDLEFLRNFDHVTAIDITPAMITRLTQRSVSLGMSVKAYVMDGNNLEFENASFDAVILHLIVAVIPNPVRCLQEAERVLKQGGKLTIMDKFIQPNTRPSTLRRLLNPITNLLATNVNRDINQLLAHTHLTKETHDKLDSIFWNITARKRH